MFGRWFWLADLRRRESDGCDGSGNLPDEAECILQIYGLKNPVGPSVGARQIKVRALRSK